MPAEEFALEMRWNLVGFYLQLSHCFFWNYTIQHFAELIASEYVMRVSVGDDKLYNLVDNKYIDYKVPALETGDNWSKTFRVLARRHIVGNATTLWCDLFTMSILFNQQPLNSQVLIVPCYFEICAEENHSNPNEALLRFTVKPPQAMGSLEPTLPNITERLSNPSPGTPIILLPLLMYDHNPHLLVSEESVYPLFYKKTSSDYLESIDADLKQRDSMVTDLSLDDPTTGPLSCKHT